jgi:hypothetical protein
MKRVFIENWYVAPMRSGPSVWAIKREDDLFLVSIFRSILIRRNAEKLITEPSLVTREVTRSAVPSPSMIVPPVI